MAPGSRHCHRAWKMGQPLWKSAICGLIRYLPWMPPSYCFSGYSQSVVTPLWFSSLGLFAVPALERQTYYTRINKDLTRGQFLIRLWSLFLRFHSLSFPVLHCAFRCAPTEDVMTRNSAAGGGITDDGLQKTLLFNWLAEFGGEGRRDGRVFLTNLFLISLSNLPLQGQYSLSSLMRFIFSMTTAVQW